MYIIIYLNGYQEQTDDKFDVAALDWDNVLAVVHVVT